MIYWTTTNINRIGGQATAYKMDLLYNGQYRMVELSRFFFTRDNVDDVMLVPTIMEKLCQLQVNSSYFNIYMEVVF